MSAQFSKSARPTGYTPGQLLRIPPELRLEAAERLVGRPGTPSGGRGAAQRFLDAAAANGVELGRMWAVIDELGRKISQVCLAVPGAGRTGMLFTSQPKGKREQEELAAAIDAAAGSLGPGWLAQGLLEPKETGAREAFTGAGFLRLGDLMYLQRAWTALDPPARGEEEGDAWPEGIAVEGWREGDDETLMAALERSYVDTLDCPELCGLRDRRDVLDSHRSTGKFDPNLWWLVRHRGEPAGALLLNPCPAQAHTELVYLGLGPELRGKGLADRLLRMGLRELGKRAERDRTVTCAVDLRNEPARRLYERHGFKPFARRIAVVRRIDE